MKKIIFLTLLAFASASASYAQRCNCHKPLTSVADSTQREPTLSEMRMQIDSLDDCLIDLLAARMKVCLAVGEYKKVRNIAVVQSSRYHELVERLCERGKAAGLSEAFVRRIMEVVHDESVRRQGEIR